ncbi:MAG: hypothetical protein U0V73_06600 [Acidimicrobiia bacterium]
MALAALPRLPRIDSLARDRVLPVPGPVGSLLPGSGLQRGSVITVGGPVGAGTTTLTLQLVAAATAAGEWAAAVDPEGTVGGWAAAELGVAPERFAVVRRVPPARWTTVVAALLDGVSLVVAGSPPLGLRVGDARRLMARARERSSVLVVAGAWPAEAALRFEVHAASWPGLERGAGCLEDRVLDVRVRGRGHENRLRVVS